MNVLGKILVILNLIFAVAVGGFLVVDFATRNNWRDAYFKLRDEMKVAEANYRVVPDSLGRFNADNKRLEAERDTARKDVTDLQDTLKAKEATHKLEIEAADLRAKDAQLAMQKLLAESERLQKEHQLLLAANKARDAEIVQQQATIVKYRNAAVAEESARKATQDRLEQAVARIAELTNALAKASAPAGQAGGVDAVVRGKANPPSTYVEGKIDSIHPEDKELVQINVGSDKGLSKNQTLEVFRVDAKLYLGLLRIVDVQPHYAVGRLERINAANRAQLRVGDTVASTLTRN
ncbi:MAG: hypothetical protein L0Y71_02335 [Gemmataceae bacterium]|nr:hypothetical protein [Gemmataceae bacterium]